LKLEKTSEMLHLRQEITTRQRIDSGEVRQKTAPNQFVWLRRRIARNSKELYREEKLIPGLAAFAERVRPQQ
jgi:hypothetical protein